MDYKPYQVVRQFEEAVAFYCGSPHAVAVNSCTNGLFLCLQLMKARGKLPFEVNIPKRTYVGVAHSIKNSGCRPTFRNETWSGMYQLRELPIYDAARRFTQGMYLEGTFIVTSHHWAKPLGVQQGGMILTDDADAVEWLKRARFDGRTEGVKPKDDKFDVPGWHMYMTPEIAAEGLVRLSFLKSRNPDMPNDDYPDLSKAPIFQ